MSALKRKRSALNEDETPSTGPNNKRLKTQQAQAEQKIAYGKKLLARALKTARGFERQKLGRRQKAATSSEDASQLLRIESEIKALKALDLVLAAEAHLHKTLSKIKSIATAPALPEYVRVPSRGIADVATANVTARLYNSNPVKEAMADIVDSVRKALGDKEPDSKGAKTPKTKGDGKRRMEDEGRGSKKVAFESPEPDEEASGSDTGDDEGSDDEEDYYARFNDRIVGSSDEEDGASASDAMEEDGLAVLPAPTPGQRPSVRYIPDPDLSPSPPPFDSPSPSASGLESASAPDFPPFSPSPSPKPTTKPVVLTNTTQKPKTSTFIPSMTLGGYISGSESEASDIDVAPRKNRRGQRARQQIWEKKYGEKAKHISSSKKDDRNRGWDPRKGAQEDGQGGKGLRGKRQRGPKSFGRGPEQSGANAEAVKPRNVKPKRDDEGPLHPSWEAKKKAKEQKGTAAFQGKKVVFD